MSGLPTARELTNARRWCDEAFSGDPQRVPFSCTYAGESSRKALQSWTAQRQPVKAAGERSESLLEYRDPSSGLVCRCEITEFETFPAVEWMLRFTNEGDTPTDIIADVNSLDISFAHGDESVRIHGAKGSSHQPDDFSPTETTLSADTDCRIGSGGGRPSHAALPFFNVDLGTHGVIGAVGWTGCWNADFRLSEDTTVVCTAGMPGVHLRLLPGESIRLPRILLLFWEDDRLHGHNLLRRLIIAHHTPSLGSEEAPEPPTSLSVWGENEADRQLAKIRWLAENDIEIDNFWIDAGWHGDTPKSEKPTVFNTDWWRHVGNWWHNEPNYPDGLAPIGRFARENGMKFTLWFESERVHKDTKIAHEHPEWLLGRPGDDSFLLDLGNAEAWAFITDTISSCIEEYGVTVYRQDFNMDPEPYWEMNEEPDRRGMRQIRHIEGLYAFWDTLLERHPGLMIDNCASGGQRIDLEMISRSIPLWRSDMQCFPGFDPIGMQSQTHGLSLWVPLSTGACERPDLYAFRSAVLPGICIITVVAGPDEPEGYKCPWDAYPVEWLKTAVHEQRQVRKYASGDFYPLVSFSMADDSWAVWQFDRPDIGEGALVALRRQNSPFPVFEARLHGIDPEAEYEVYSFDDDETVQYTGRDILDGALTVEISDTPGSRLYRYRKI